LVAQFTNGVEGVAAARCAVNMGVGYKSTLVFIHKVREAMFQSRDTSPMSGEVEVDGCYFHYYVRPKNHRTNRVDRRKQQNMNPNKRAVLALRMRGSPGNGAIRTIVEIIKHENERDVRDVVMKYVNKSTIIFSDEHSCYTSLAAHYDVRQVNHAEAYSQDGINENQAESIFARMRKQHSIIHRCAPKYLRYYANEIAWRDDNRRKSFFHQFEEILMKCLSTGPSRLWAKYWQGNHLSADTLFMSSEHPMN